MPESPRLIEMRPDIVSVNNSGISDCAASHIADSSVSLNFLHLLRDMDIENLFTEAGGEFCVPFATFTSKLKHIRAFIFDWDGVFNDGIKDHQGSSNFNEVDAMGTNLLRFGHWVRTGELPIVAVMSGEKNTLSFQLTLREHFHNGYFRVKDKLLAFNHFLELHRLNAAEVAFVFDDVLDLGLASKAGIRIMVQHQGSPLFKNHVRNNGLADYIASPSPYAIREACELMLSITGNYSDVVTRRAEFSADYGKYFNIRQSMTTEFYTWHDNVIQRAEV